MLKFHCQCPQPKTPAHTSQQSAIERLISDIDFSLRVLRLASLGAGLSGIPRTSAPLSPSLRSLDNGFAVPPIPNTSAHKSEQCAGFMCASHKRKTVLPFFTSRRIEENSVNHRPRSIRAARRTKCPYRLYEMRSSLHDLQRALSQHPHNQYRRRNIPRLRRSAQLGISKNALSAIFSRC